MGSQLSHCLSYVENNVLAKAATVDTGIQWAMFAVSWVLGTEKFYDLTGAATNLALTWATLYWSKNDTSLWSPRQLAQSACVSLWALRLGGYLFSRVLASGEDRRFRLAKKNPAMFFMYWTMQALWIWITIWPTMIINSTDVEKPLSTIDYAGYGIFAVGFLLEIIADHQKSAFRSIDANKDKYINSGLWSISRHPNYFGEILLWSGLFLPATSVLKGNEWASAISPFFVALLITKVSGVPILERYADKKWGALAEYQKYKASTAKLIPFIW